MGIKVDDIKIGNRSVVAGAVNLPFLKGEQGKEGEQGEQGIGIKSVEQIVTSTEDNGINIIEVTLENEIKSTFEVRNGSRGDGQGGSYDDTEIKKELQNKVDKVSGKSLVSDSEILRLSNLKNYDDTAIRQLIEDNLTEAKEYTDTEIANFDFVKIVDELPIQGLPNKVYFVPKQGSETNNIFEEYAWISGAWESFGTKTVEIDLTEVNADIEELQKNKADKTEIPTQISDLEDNKNQLVPTGGNKGQILAKRSDLSNDTEWKDSNLFVEEGTWTPSINTIENAPPTVTYTAQIGTYRKIGDKVFITFRLRGKITALTGTNNYGKVDGLPFPIKSGLSYCDIALNDHNNLFATGNKTNTSLAVNSKYNGLNMFVNEGTLEKIKVTDYTYFTLDGNGWYLTE